MIAGTGCGTPSGTNSTGCATSFPHALALGATFNRSLWSMVGAVIGLEGRALQNENAGGGVAYFVSSQAIAIQLDPKNHRRYAIACEVDLCR